jgi:hypothetical protein
MSELRLRWPIPLGSNRWTYRSLTFDLSAVLDDHLLPWIVQGLETGIVASISSDAVANEVKSLIANGQPRTIRFFSSGRDFVSGTGLAMTSDYNSTGVSGMSTWVGGIAHRDKPLEKPTAPADRKDLRMFLNATGGSGMSLPEADGSLHPTYSYLVGTLWHELHHMAATDYEQHIKGSPPYEPYWQAAMNAIKSGFPPEAWEPISKRMVPLWTSQWASIQCQRTALA